MFPKTSAYVNIYDDETKWMYFSTENDELLEKYNIQEKVSTSFKKEFDSELIYNKNFLKTKIRS